MIKPILLPHQFLELLMYMYQVYPALLYAMGAVFGLLTVGIVYFVVRDIQKPPNKLNERGVN